MPHLRERYLARHIQTALKFSSLVGVLGQRQVGKTTLLESLVGQDYVTMDDDQTLAAVLAKPQGYLENFSKLTAIDECQKAPELFSALKLRVQRDKRPGQFLLSGSVRFTSRKEIQETLTGRIFNLELLPMTLAETHHLPCLDYKTFFTADFGKVQTILKKRQETLRPKSAEQYIKNGGLPGICFLREESHRNGKFKSHIETLLQRDIRLISKTTAPYDSLLLLLTYLAENQGQAFSLKESAQAARLTQNTVKKLIEAFEGLFLIRRVVGFGFRTGPQYFLEDQGMASYLLLEKNKNYLSRFLFSQIFSNTHYAHQNKFQLGHFETKSGLRLDFVARLDDMNIGFLYEDTEAPSSKALRAAESFLAENKNSGVVLLGAGAKALKMDRQMIHLPLNWIA